MGQRRHQCFGQMVNRLQTASQTIREVLLQHSGHPVRVGVQTEGLHRGRRQPRVATGIHAREFGEPRTHVECQTMHATAVAHAQAKSGDFRATHVYPRSIGTSLRTHTESDQCFDHAVLKQVDQCTDTQPVTAQVEQHVDYHLPGTMKRHLPAAIDPDRGYCIGPQKVLRACITSEGENRGVLNMP